MSVFSNRWTPIAAPGGAQTFALPGTTQLLSTLVSIPPEASSCMVQGIGDTSFSFRLDGTEGEGPSTCMVATELPLSNRTDLDQLVVCSNGGAVECIVQFSLGSVGP